MTSLSRNDFRFKRTALQKKPLAEQSELVRELGSYFLEVSGAELEGDLVLEAEQFLNELYSNARTEGIQPALQEHLREAAGIANYLGYAMTQQKLDPNFFMTMKRLGSTLLEISGSI